MYANKRFYHRREVDKLRLKSNEIKRLHQNKKHTPEHNSVEIYVLIKADFREIPEILRGLIFKAQDFRNQWMYSNQDSNDQIRQPDRMIKMHVDAADVKICMKILFTPHC